MTILYTILVFVVIGLLIYLFVSLIKPEMFP